MEFKTEYPQEIVPSTAKNNVKIGECTFTNACSHNKTPAKFISDMLLSNKIAQRPASAIHKANPQNFVSEWQKLFYTNTKSLLYTYHQKGRLY